MSCSAESLSDGQSAPGDSAAHSTAKLLIAPISVLFIRCVSRRKSDDIRTKPQSTLKLLFLHPAAPDILIIFLTARRCYDGVCPELSFVV